MCIVRGWEFKSAPDHDNLSVRLWMDMYFPVPVHQNYQQQMYTASARAQF